MKLKLFILPFCLMAINLFAFEGTINQTIKNYNGQGIDVNMTWSISANGCRIDMVASSKDIKSNTVLILDPAAKILKTYEVSSGAGQKLYFQVNASDIGGSVPATTVTATQDTRQIQGFKCQKYIVATAKGSYNVWVTTDIAMDWSAYKDFFRTSIEIQALAQQGIKGFPMLTESQNGDNAASVSTVSAHSIPGTTFVVPSEYTLYVPGTPFGTITTK